MQAFLLSTCNALVVKTDAGDAGVMPKEKAADVGVVYSGVSR
jgi:hypothetical protein